MFNQNKVTDKWILRLIQMIFVLLFALQSPLNGYAADLHDDIIKAGELSLDTVSHRVMVNETPVELGPTEFRLLHFFMSHAERVFSRSQLLDQVWGNNVYIEERTVDVHIRRLRRALEPYFCDKYIQTVRGAGYRFSEQV